MEISGLEPEAFSLLTKRDTSYTISPAININHRLEHQLNKIILLTSFLLV